MTMVGQNVSLVCSDYMHDFSVAVVDEKYALENIVLMSYPIANIS
jgi:hypothetical protein